MSNNVLVEKCDTYDLESVDNSLSKFTRLFEQTIKPGQKILLKPNWISHCHKYNQNEWKSVITHSNFITGIINKVLRYLNGSGKIIIADGPQTDSSFDKIGKRMTIDAWKKIGSLNGVGIEVLDLRDHEWVNKGDVTIGRKQLAGDPLGSVDYNLKGLSEFVNHIPSGKGYYGADYDIKETTEAHTNEDNIYRISRTVIDADVFINLPKWKTHKKAGITCSLKNLVGVNTYKNFLPHHTEGTPSMGGDQFPGDNINNVLEVYLLELFKKIMFKHEKYAKYFSPIKKLGKIFFGETKNKIRSGNWYGNNTLWRTILDLNKLVLYGNPDGSIKRVGLSAQKPYLSFIDGIISGEGNGPEAPDPIHTKLIIGGSNPVSIDCVAAKLMGFEYSKIPTLYHAFSIRHLPIVDFSYDDIMISSETMPDYNGALGKIPKEKCFNFRPHFGWANHIELE